MVHAAHSHSGSPAASVLAPDRCSTGVATDEAAADTKEVPHIEHAIEPAGFTNVHASHTNAALWFSATVSAYE